MCADVAIHDPYPPGHNPHAHILLTVRPLDEKGKWQYKTEKEYLCVKNGKEQGFTAAEFKQAQADGWEKQYQYKVGKKKVYMVPSSAQAQGYERVSKYPKSTKYGRQNPISERWNSEEQLVFWRKAWADVTNLHLERAGQEGRIDYRGHAERELEEQPTIHEGVIARALEKKGIVSDRCELNRQIKADNALLRELKAQMKKMAQAVKNSLPAIAEAMETLRANMIVFRYQLRHISRGKYKLSQYLDAAKPTFAEYLALVQKIKTAAKERKTMLTEKKEISFWNVSKHKELSAKIAKLTEDIEELKTEKAVFLHKISNILMVFHTVQLRESFLILRQNAAAVCRHQNLVFQPQRQHDLHIVFSIDQRPLRTLLKCIRHKFARIVVHLQCHGIIIFAVHRRRAYRPDGTGRRRCGGSRGRRGRPAPRTGSQAECQSQG